MRLPAGNVRNTDTFARYRPGPRTLLRPVLPNRTSAIGAHAVRSVDLA